jgi:ribonuclease P protein component
MDERFPQEERITKKSDFERILKYGEKRRSENLILIHNPSYNRRIGIILSKRIKKAVIRNKIKRRIRDIYRKNKKKFKGEYLIIVYPGIEKLGYAELKDLILAQVSDG